GGNGGGSGGSGGSGSGHGDVGINNRLDKLIALEGRSAIARESMQADTKNLISIGSNTYQEIQTGFSSTVGQLRTLGSMLGNGFSGLSSVVADGNNEIGNVDNSLIRNGDKLDAIKGQLVENGKGTKGIGDSLTSIDSKLDDLNDGSNTNAGSNGCGNNTFNCSGNDYECYMAKQSYLTACNIQSLASNNNGNDGDNSGGDGSGAKGAITKSGNDLIGSIRAYNSNNGNPSKLFDGEIALDSTLNKYDESNGFSFDSKCPVPNRVNYGLGTIEISYQPFCELALYIRAMLMLSASIASILMIAKFS
ncbi:virulence factor TspB C-terminal domain-related protein, partial [Vibrio atlanticus]|uniref:virulence factor TspB C-terminal domain-related protein n=1 Tax=Vibrio atlanticus TaxID=693153 RepID=UPI00354B22D7